MASHMGVQTFATERNSQVELLIHFILEEFFLGLQQKGLVKGVKIEMQKQFVSEIASDVWDHHVTLIQGNGIELEIWCQTTSYKGNGTGTPEPNKTYEVRETLVEGLSIRQKFRSDNSKDYRSIHFTLGDSAYTYKWFMDLKAAVYDKSIYIGVNGYNIFDDIDTIFSTKHTEDGKRAGFKECLKKKSHLKKAIVKAISELKTWWNDGKHASSTLGNLQWDIIEKQITKSKGKWPDFNVVKGQNIKGRTNALVFSDDPSTEDHLIRKTAVKLLAKNPFLSTSIEVIAGWSEFIKGLQGYADQKATMREFIIILWDVDMPQRLVVRRLLLRIHTKDSIAYVQDLNIKGITEHNIYSKDHTKGQQSKISDQIVKDLLANGINNTQKLVDQIKVNGKKLINQARWFEAKNGTELKPSFDYVEIALEEKGYRLVAPSKVGLNVKGYHAEISSENVRPYTNLKAIINGSNKVLCIIKAKFFRSQEFPRRCKEEAFVGLTLRNSYNNGLFTEKAEIPLVMFVDMALDCIVPEHAIKRLISFGWQPVFSVDELLIYLKELEAI